MEGQAEKVRREPRQLRSRRMVEKILGAAARVFSEEGLEGATTNRIAEAAGVSVGSIYQFFPHKTALLMALGERHRARVRDLLGEALAPTGEPLESVIDHVLGIFETLDAEQPGLLRVLTASELPHDLWTDASFEGQILERVETLLAARASHLSPGRRSLVARMSVHITDGLFTCVPPRSGVDPAVKGEVRAALLAYLGPIMSGAGEGL